MNTKAFDKYCEKQARNNSVFWTGVLTGRHPAMIENAYGVKEETLRKQARQAGFYTRIWGEEIQISRRKFNTY